MDERADQTTRSAASPLAETIDTSIRRLVTGFVIGSAAIALAIYAARPASPRFEVDVVGSTVIRTDIRSGTVLACEGQRCYTVVRRGQRLADGPATKALPAPEPQRALPAPTAQPSTVNAQ